MCGIMGYIGREQASGILLEGLKKLTYRGYDSAGLAVMDPNGKIAVCKENGKLKHLLQAVRNTTLDGFLGIAHTRWATHGEPTRINAHPQMDAERKIAVVHNGIIENYAFIKHELEAKGVSFVSQTDTEVLAHLIRKLYTGNMLETLLELQKRIKGSYALGILNGDEKDKLYCVRQNSPLSVAVTEEAAYFASDLTALLPYSRDVLFLDDGEIGIFDSKGITIYNRQGKMIDKNPEHVSWEVQSAEKDGFEHHMLKEIVEQPEVLQKTISFFRNFSKTSAGINFLGKAKSIRKFTIVGCGTAYYAGLFGKYVFEKIAETTTSAEVASEYRYAYRHPFENECVLTVSQSGETADTLAAFSSVQNNVSCAMALCNVPGSSLARAAGDTNTFYTYAGPEIAVASTKAYLAQAGVLLIIAFQMACDRQILLGMQKEKLRFSLERLPQKAKDILKMRDQIRSIADKYKNIKHIFLIGRGIDYAVCREAALKLKEVSYIFAEAYPAGELKHGPIALLEEDSLVISIITQPETADKTISNLQEVRARKAKVFALCISALKESVSPNADDTMIIDEDNEWTAPLLSIIPLQLFAYYMAVARECDVDQPRNLAKSVTVE